mmetsp:Transcript_28996/g.5247  ORF Transcript_28996/g.5247 Transcript_28996/m.5247 type:complete len:80 (+) Transcript_28996:277-516(+)
MRIIPFSGLEFYSFEVCKKYLLHDNDRVNKPRLLLSGCIAGIVAMIVTYPLDLLRGYASINTDKSGAKIITELRYMLKA